jgi:hypothetical protein
MSSSHARFVVVVLEEELSDVDAGMKCAKGLKAALRKR